MTPIVFAICLLCVSQIVLAKQGWPNRESVISLVCTLLALLLVLYVVLVHR